MKYIALLLILIFLNPFINSFNVNKIDEKKYTREWWDIDAFINAGKNYSITSSFEYEKETPAANLFLTIFDRDKNRYFELGSYNDDIDKLKIKGDYIKYGKCWIKPSYPIYEAYFERKGVKLYIELKAESPLMRVASGITNDLPFGFGYYNYTFTSKCIAKGWIYIDGIKRNFTGIGYYEHVYGNWSYNSPLKNFSFNSLKKYINLFKWWKNGMNLNFKNITISSNNPFGYDWSWGFFDNGWTIFFGNIPSWIENIPMGIIYIYDGKKYMQFKLIKYEYLNGEFFDEEFFPRKIKIFANGNGTLHLIFNMSYKPHIYEDNLSSFYWKKLFLYECPGKIYGWLNNSKKINLNGSGEIEIERQISIFGYNLLKIFFHFPYPFGIELYFLSYLIKISIEMGLFLLPFYINFSFSKIR